MKLKEQLQPRENRWEDWVRSGISGAQAATAALVVLIASCNTKPAPEAPKPDLTPPPATAPDSGNEHRPTNPYEGGIETEPDPNNDPLIQEGELERIPLRP